MSYDDLILIFSAFDLNRDQKISLKEFVKTNESFYAPMTSHLEFREPWIEVSNQIYNYMDVYRKTSPTDLTPKHDKRVSKSDLKSRVPVFWPEQIGNDDFVDRQFYLRDYNGDGMIDKNEHNRFNYHYKVLRKFWNISKGQGSKTEYVEGDDDIMTWVQWSDQDNPWLRSRNFKNKNVEIPMAAFKDMWNKFNTDEDKMTLSFNEIWNMW